MELTYEEQLQLGNSKEHLRVVLGNLRIANEELSMVLSLINSANETLTKVTQESERIGKENTEFLRTVSEINATQNRREVALTDRENRIDTKEKEINEQIRKANNQLDLLNRQGEEVSSKYQKKIDELKSVITEYETDIALLRIELDNIGSETKQQLALKKKVEKSIVELEEEKDELEKKITKFKNDFESALEESKELIEKEKDKIKNPYNLLVKKEIDIDRKTKDMNILKDRLVAIWKVLYPDKELKI